MNIFNNGTNLGANPRIPMGALIVKTPSMLILLANIKEKTPPIE